MFKARHLFLEVVSGPGITCLSVWLEPGDLCRIGAGPDNDLQLAGASPKAGTLLCTQDGVGIYGAVGVLLDGQAVGPAQTLRLNDILEIGPSRVRISGYPALADSNGPSPLGDLIAWMRQVRSNLFAIFDAAQSPRVRGLLTASGLRHLSLFDGDTRVRMADSAPYLVSIPKDSPALELLVRASWGKGWATFLTSDQEFFETRSRLRRYLMAALPGGGTGYFRFFDPFVLQALLPAMKVPELEDFCRGTDEFIVEHREWPDLAVRFYVSRLGRDRRIEIHPIPKIGRSAPIYERPS